MGGKPGGDKGGKPDMGGMYGGKPGKDDMSMGMMGMMGAWKDKWGNMMEAKEEMGEKLDAILSMVKTEKAKNYELWNQDWSDATDKYLMMNFAGTEMCAVLSKEFRPFKHMAIEMEDCSDADALSFNFMGNYLVMKNNYGKQFCLTATPNTNFGLEAPFAHFIHLAECELTMPEDGQKFDGASMQHF